ncbi:MAG: DUF4435 domain-containing protein [Muribaculaceae bacterium]|nr:DUF4435 domain-containing protein [Muribaculaceae bacterium]
MSTDKSEFYRLAARRYAASTRLYGVDSIVHIEDNEDKWLWQQLLSKYRPGRYEFYPGSINHSGKPTTGCEQCLKYKAYLSQRFFIAIDSDLRYLMDEGLRASNGVLQTYAYSWENHCCFAEKLQKDFAEKTGRGGMFNFVEFLQQYSEIVYEPFLIMLYHQRNTLHSFDRKKFKQIISIQYRGGDEADNGRPILDRLKNRFTNELQAITVNGSIDITDEAARYEAKGVTRDNVYLYVRGHCLYNLLNSLGKKLCEGTGADFEEDILKSALAYGEYEAIDLIRNDIEILSTIRQSY